MWEVIVDKEDPEDFCYVGDCPVCEEPVDESDAGYCGDCGQAFCWGHCGDWQGDVQKCNNCKKHD